MTTPSARLSRARHLLRTGALPAAVAAAAAAAVGLIAAPVAGGATTTIIGALEARGTIAQHNGLVVVTQLGEHGRATLAVGGKFGAPRAIKTHALPPWGQPHVGTSEIGTTVIVYPHCYRAAFTTCNLFAFDVTTGTDTQLRGEASRRGSAEIEGDMDRGALAIARWHGARAPAVPVTGGLAQGTTELLYQPFGKPARALAEPGGQQIDLDRGRIAQVRRLEPDAKGCRAATIELVDTRGGVRRVARRPCAGRQALLAPTLLGRDLVWGLRTDTASWLYRAPVRGADDVVRAPTGPFSFIAPSGPNTAFQIRGDTTPALGSDPARLLSPWTFTLPEELPLR
ncbi:MAG: hypothetical protein PGN13_11045 [Patulibacter minatonensis]